MHLKDVIFKSAEYTCAVHPARNEKKNPNWEILSLLKRIYFCCVDMPMNEHHPAQVEDLSKNRKQGKTLLTS